MKAIIAVTLTALTWIGIPILLFLNNGFCFKKCHCVLRTLTSGIKSVLVNPTIVRIVWSRNLDGKEFHKESPVVRCLSPLEAITVGGFAPPNPLGYGSAAKHLVHVGLDDLEVCGSKYLAAAILKQVKDLEHDVIASFLLGWYATHVKDLIT